MFRFALQSVCLPVLVMMFATLARAEICVYRDADGHITYSNVTASPPKDASKVRCFKETRPPAAAQGQESTPGPADASPKSAAGFPKVDSNTQRRRDDERRKILQDELAAEKQRLEEAEQALAEQESLRSGNERNYQRYLDRVQPYRDAVENHQRNMEAIQRELANMR